jgi:hypothetical protein
MTVLYNTRLVRAAALLPQTGTASIFTITGGLIRVDTFFGLAVTATPATVNTLQVKNTPAAGTPLAISTAVSVASLEAGSHVSLTDAAGGALVVGNAGTCPRPLDPGFIVNTGAIQLTTTGSAATGTWAWYLMYTPLEPNALCVAA